MNELTPDGPEGRSEIILYQTEDGQTRLEVRLVGETVWLSLNQMADLFQRDKSVIWRHVRNVFGEGELPGTGRPTRWSTIVSTSANTRSIARSRRIGHRGWRGTFERPSSRRSGWSKGPARGRSREACRPGSVLRARAGGGGRMPSTGLRLCEKDEVRGRW